MSSQDKKLALIALLFSFAGGLIYWQFFSVQGTGGPSKTAPLMFASEPPVIHQLTDIDGLPSSGRPLFLLGKPLVRELAAPQLEEAEFIRPTPEPAVPAVSLAVRINPRPLPEPAAPPAPPMPPGPQVITLQYTGFARDGINGMIAFLETPGPDDSSDHYNLREEDFFLGRFRVKRITADAVEVEDLERPENSSDRKRTIAINASLARRR